MKDELFDELIESVRQGGVILRGEAKPSRSFEISAPDVKRVRERYKLSQPEFASMLGVGVATLRNWEQGRRAPTGPARVLLRVAEQNPNAIWDAVRPAQFAEKQFRITRTRTSRIGKLGKPSVQKTA